MGNDDVEEQWECLDTPQRQLEDSQEADNVNHQEVDLQLWLLHAVEQ